MISHVDGNTTEWSRDPSVPVRVGVCKSAAKGEVPDSRAEFDILNPRQRKPGANLFRPVIEIQIVTTVRSAEKIAVAI